MNRIRKILVLSFILMLVLAACGKEDEEANVLKMAMGADPTTFDPAMNGDFLTSALIRNLYDGLVRLDENDNPVESVAEKINISEDGLTYTFELRESEWSNGDPVTAEDFKYSWMRILNPDTGSTNADIFFLIKNAKKYYEGEATAEEVGIVADGLTLTVELEYPAPYFLELATGSHYVPLNKKVVEADERWADNPEKYVSNGPFKLDSYKIKDEVVFKKNEKYWDADKVELEKVSFVIIEDKNTAMNMFNTNKLNWIGSPLGGLPGDAIPELSKEGKIETKSTAHASTLILHLDQKPFTNNKIRKAFSYAINRADLTEHILQGGQTPALALAPPTMSLKKEGYFKDNDVDTAKKLLQEGMDELGITEIPELTYLYISSETGHEVAQLLQSQLKDNLGVNLKLESLEAKVFFDVQFKEEKDHHLSIAGWTADYNDPIDFFQSYIVSEEYENEQYWDLLEKAKYEAKPETRDSLLLEAETILMEDMPIVPLYNGVNNWMKSDSVEGVVMTSISHFDLKNARVK